MAQGIMKQESISRQREEKTKKTKKNKKNKISIFGFRSSISLQIFDLSSKTTRHKPAGRCVNNEQKDSGMDSAP